MKAISNLLQAERGEVTKGSIEFEGQAVHSLTPNELVKMGCIQVMEGRHVFEHRPQKRTCLPGPIRGVTVVPGFDAILSRFITIFPASRNGEAVRQVTLPAESNR